MTRRPTLAVYLGIYVPILILALGILYPLYYFALNSLNGGLVFGPAWLLAEDLTLRNYRIIFGNGRVLDAFLMSVSRTVVGRRGHGADVRHVRVRAAQAGASLP